MKEKTIHMSQALLTLFIVCLLVRPCGAKEKATLDNTEGKESYSLGYQFGTNLKKQQVDLNLEAIITGISDAFEGKSPKLGEDQMKEVLDSLKKKVWTAQQVKFQEQASKNLKESNAFLTENAKKDGIVTLPSGLQYKVVTEGNGASPKATDRAKVHYRGTLVDGTEFDSSYGRGKPSTVHVGGVIKGWTEALQLMKEGSTWQVFVPAKLAYGKRQFGRIPPNSTLIFTIELLSVEAGPDPTSTESTPLTETLPDEAAQNSTVSWPRQEPHQVGGSTE